MNSAELKSRVDVDPNAAIVLFTLAGSLSFYGTGGLAIACQDHAQEMLGRIAQLRRDNKP